MTGARRLQACRLLLALWLPLFLWANLPGPMAGAAVAGGLQLLTLLAFVAIHASLAYGWRGAAAFLLVGYVTGLVLEATSIAYGVPFGYFTHFAPVPRLLGVPIHVPMAYAFLGWLAWTLACLLARADPAGWRGPTRWLVPLLGALILTGYDLAYDAIGSAAKGMWAYRYPGGYFGVPLSNFIGWIVTGTAILAIFTLIEPRFAGRRTMVARSRGYWLMPCLLWGAMVLQYPLLQLAAPAGDVLVGGRRFVLADIYAAATIAALLAMLPPALAAAARAMLIAPPPGGGPPHR